MIEKPEAEQTQEPMPEELEQHEVHEVLDFLKSYGKTIGGSILLAVLVYLGLSWFRQSRVRDAAEASRLLAAAQTPEQFQAILGAYADAPVAPIAQLGLAAEYFRSGQYDQAMAQYDAFLKAEPKHLLRPDVELNRIQCQEALRQYPEALVAYQAFAKKYADHYRQPAARLGEGRCLEQMGRLDEARAVYEDVMTASPDSAWAGQAGSYLQVMPKAAAPAAQPAPKAPAAVPAPAAAPVPAPAAP